MPPLHLHRAAQQSSFGWPASQRATREGHCEDLAPNFAERVTWLLCDLDAVDDAGPVDVPLTPAGPIIMELVQLVQSEFVDRIFGQMKATTCALDPYPSWLTKAARGRLAE